MNDDFDRELRMDGLDEIENHARFILDFLLSSGQAEEKSFEPIFRQLHSIKGLAQTCGFLEIAKLSHRYEDILILVRDGKIADSKLFRDSFQNFIEGVLIAVDDLRKNLGAPTQLACLIPEVEKILGGAIETKPNGPKILVVDDEPDIVELLTEVLVQDLRASIFVAGNGSEALKPAQTQDFDVIITDFRMPMLTGSEFLERIRREPGPNQLTPFIMLSGFRPEISDNLETWHRVLFLDKPLDVERLRYYIKCSIRSRDL